MWRNECCEQGGAEKCVRSVILPSLDDCWNIPTMLAALEFSFYISGSYVMQVSRTAYPKWAGGIYCVALCWAHGCYWTREDWVCQTLGHPSIHYHDAKTKVNQNKQRLFMTGCTHTGAVGISLFSTIFFLSSYTLSPRRRKHTSNQDDARDRAGCKNEWPLFSAEL